MPGQIDQIVTPLGELKQGEFLLETLYSSISHGTEMAFFEGTNPKLNKQFDAKRRLFVAIPDDAEAAEDNPNNSGCMRVGRVAASRNSIVEPGSLIGWSLAKSMATDQHARLVITTAALIVYIAFPKTFGTLSKQLADLAAILRRSRLQFTAAVHCRE